MEANSKKEQIVDVRSVVEAVSADDSDAPLYQVESLCMRCGENVRTQIPSLNVFLFSFFMYLCFLMHVRVFVLLRGYWINGYWVSSKMLYYWVWFTKCV
jgi:hypothetical protein